MIIDEKEARIIQAVLEQNGQVRANGGSRTLSFGKLVASIPEAVWYNDPYLASKDKRVRNWRLRQLLNDSDYKKFLLKGD